MTTNEKYIKVENLEIAKVYKFRVKARNEFDYSDFSDPFEMQSGYIPTVPKDVALRIEDDILLISWKLDNDHGAEI